MKNDDVIYKTSSRNNMFDKTFEKNLKKFKKSVDKLKVMM